MPPHQVRPVFQQQPAWNYKMPPMTGTLMTCGLQHRHCARTHDSPIQMTGCQSVRTGEVPHHAAAKINDAPKTLQFTTWNQDAITSFTSFPLPGNRWPVSSRYFDDLRFVTRSDLHDRIYWPVCTRGRVCKYAPGNFQWPCCEGTRLKARLSLSGIEMIDSVLERDHQGKPWPRLLSMPIVDLSVL